MSTVAILSKYANESRKIAEQVAFKLGYPLVTTDDVVKAAAKEGEIAENELSAALTDISTFSRLFRKRKIKKSISILESTLCEFMAEKPIVFCGCLGYPIFNEISHVLQVLVLGNPVPDENPENQEAKIDLFSDEKIVEWFRKIYEDDMEDPNLYDLCINLGHMNESEAAEIVVSTLGQKRFTPMTYSTKAMADFCLALRIKTKLIESMPDIQVKSHDGSVYMYSKALKRSREKATGTKQEIMWIEGVNYVEICNDQKSFQAA